MSKRSRAAMAAAVAAAWLLLTGARQAAGPLPDMLLPLMPEHPIGIPFSAKPGDVILRGRIVQSMSVSLDEAAAARLDRFEHAFKIGDRLTPVLIKTTKNGPIKMIFCGPDQRAISDFQMIMIGELGSKFEKIVRFCFQDEDNDGKFEGYILAGAKDAKLQSVIPIAPISYTRQNLVPFEKGGELVVTYEKFSPNSQKATLGLSINIDGEPRPFDYFSTMIDGEMVRDYPRLTTNPKKIPYPMQFNRVAGATIAINSVQPNGEASMRIKKNFVPTLIKPVSIQTQTIYVYVYTGG